MTPDPKAILTQTPCLDEAEMKAYLHDTLDKAAIRKVEMHLADCEICSDMVDGMSMYGLDEIEPAVEEMRLGRDESKRAGQESRQDSPVIALDSRQPSRSRKNGLKYFLFSIAAGLALLVGARMLFWNGARSMQTIADEYTTWESPSVWRGETQDKDSLTLGKNALAKGEFENAAGLLRAVVSEEGKYWLGQSLSRAGKETEAIKAFEESAKGIGHYSQISAFHVALIKLKTGEEEEGKMRLMKMAEDARHPKHKEASEILQEIER